jgi:PKD repeat protein
MLLATDLNGCWDTITHDVTVSETPDVSFTVDPNPACAGEATSFSGNSTSNISNWLWDFGDGGMSVDQNPLHVYTSAGTYTVSLWVGDTNNCFNSTSQTVVVNPMPLPDFTHSGAACSGDTVFFYNQSVSPNGTISTWIWDFGDGNSVTINAPNDPDVFHIYATGGPFNVTLTVTDIDSCSNFVIKPVSVTAGPIADFNYVPNCNGQPVEFTDISSPNSGSPLVSWYWEFDDPGSGALNTSVLQNPTHLFTTSGTFNVLLLVTNVEGCNDTIVLPVDVDMAPQVSFTTDSDSACVDTDMNFYGVANGSVTWSWDFGDGGVSVLQDPVHQYAAAGTYTVTVTVEDANACTASYSSNIYVNPLPIADFTYSPLPCSGSPVDFYDISSAMNAYMLSWHWYFGDGSDTIIYAPSSGDVTHLYASPGSYTVSLAIENSNTCEDSITYDVSVIQGPEAAFEHAGDICQGGTVEFTDLSQSFGTVIQTWLWQFGDPGSGSNNTSALQNPTHVYSLSGSYSVSLTVTSNTGCQHTTVDTVEIAPPPPMDWFIDPDTTCFGDLVYFFTDTDSTNISEVINYAWNFGDPASGINDTSNLMNPVHLFSAPGEYSVSLSITSIDGCQNTRVYQVDIKSPHAWAILLCLLICQYHKQQ